MIGTVRNTIEQYGMIQEGETVLCGLSGGADSVTLLLCLKELGYSIRACHVNHLLRGAESDRDEQFCCELCERLGVRLDVIRVDVRALCEAEGLSVEEAARRLRYQAFESLGCTKTATAHTLSDSMETALFNLARGTGAKGLCGIPPVRDGYIRPLIACSREEIEQFLSERGQGYVTDSTNLEDDCSRNIIRHRVIPVLKEIDPAAERAFARLSRSLAEDNAYLEGEARRLLEDASREGGYDSRRLASAGRPLLSRAVIMLLRREGLRYDEGRIGELCRMIGEGGKLCLSGSTFALCSGGVFRIAVLSEPQDEEVSVPGTGSYELCGRAAEIIITEKEQFDNKVNKLLTYLSLDYGKIRGELVIRTRRAGDSIRPAGRGCTKSLKKLFYENIPAEKRADTLLLCDAEGVIAVEGIGVSERAAVSEDTEKLLLFGTGR